MAQRIEPNQPPTQHYSFFQKLVRTFATTRIGAWFFARSAQRLDKLYLKLSRKHKPMVTIVSGLPVLILTSTGAKSGLARNSTLACIRDELDSNKIALIASNFGQHQFPAWYYNLKAHPRARCDIGGQVRSYVAHEASGEEYDRFWKLAVATFSGYETYKKLAGRHIPIMVLTPLEELPLADDSH